MNYGRTNVKKYQQLLKNKLSLIYDKEDITLEWHTKLSQKIYSPRIDVAIGPFAIDEGLISIYDDMCDDRKIQNFVNKLYNFHCENLGLELNQHFIGELKYFNSNARCFMGIEVENEVSSKHFLGGIINVSALSRVGILVPWSQKKYNLSKRMINYLEFLKRAGKNTFETKNVLIVKDNQLINAIEFEN